VEQQGRISPDGQWFWDGQKWLSTLSPDGTWRWNGSSWIAARPAAAPKAPAPGIWWLPGFRTGAAWKLPVVAVGALLLLGGIGSLASQPSSTPTGQGVAETLPSPSPPVANETLSSPSTAATSPSPKLAPSPSPTPKPSPSPKASPSPSAPAVPSPLPTAVAPPPPPPPPPSTCGAPANPWGYNFCGGNLIYSPPATICSYFNCIPSFWKSTLGYVDECKDGTYSHSGGRQGACSYHGGEMRPLYSP
jgi:hypothetical protein